MDRGIVVLNSGSDSLKFALYRAVGEDLSLECQGQIEAMLTTPRFHAHRSDGMGIKEHSWTKPIDAETGFRFLLDWGRDAYADFEVVAAGHRLVQGGTRYAAPTLVDDDALSYLDGLSMLEPTHQPPEVEGIRAIRRIDPGLPQVAVFDTSFHRTMPEVEQLFAVPKSVRDEGVRRWGYHGISYDYISRELPKHDPEARRVIVGHLGSGASLCAILDGKSIAATMGFSAIEGLPMGTRCGTIDAGALFYLLRRKLFDDASLQHLLSEESGLKGLSGVSNNVRDLLASPAPEARQAIDYFVYHLVRFAGAYTALLGGLDAIVFTAGIGEHAAPIRAEVCKRLAWLGLELDEAANNGDGPLISTKQSKVRAWVIPTDEEIMIARHTLALLDAQAT